MASQSKPMRIEKIQQHIYPTETIIQTYVFHAVKAINPTENPTEILLKSYRNTKREGGRYHPLS